MSAVGSMHTDPERSVDDDVPSRGIFQSLVEAARWQVLQICCLFS